MAQLNKIDSNVSGLRYAVEQSIGVLPGSPIWKPLEPNSYSDFGGNLTLLSRNPISQSRQRKKGVITDLDASGGFNNDLTQDNLTELLEGFMFAALRKKGEQVVTAVDIDGANPDEYEMTDTAGFLVNSLVKGSGFTNATNNGLNVVTAIVNNVSVEVATGSLVAEAVPPADAKITVVGYQFAAGTLTVSVAGDLPALVVSGGFDLTTLGLIPGEWIFVGGDATANKFFNAVDNGFKRIRSVSATQIVLDKSASVMVTDDGTINGAGGAGNTIRLFFGHVLKNETGTLVKRQSVQFERTLGAPDDAQPNDVQAEYLEGAIANELSVNISQADKVTLDLSYVASKHTTVAAGALKSGTRPTLVEFDAFNTSSDFSRIKMSLVSSLDENPTPLFAFLTELSITINNNVSPAKAVGVLGGFDVNVGTFDVGGQLTAYFSTISAVEAVRANSDVTLDFHLVKANAGISFDLPLVTLGDGRANLEPNQPITLPLSMQASTGAKVHTSLDHTMLMVFYSYLPAAADT